MIARAVFWLIVVVLPDAAIDALPAETFPPTGAASDNAEANTRDSVTRLRQDEPPLRRLRAVSATTT